MSHNVTPNTSRVELRKTLTLVPVVMMGLAYMQPMTFFFTLLQTPLAWNCVKRLR
ncbi:amino acid permease [Escherichia coli SHECO001]|nr:amino acid permease [Escherichia coli SHECO001]